MLTQLQRENMHMLAFLKDLACVDAERKYEHANIFAKDCQTIQDLYDS